MIADFGRDDIASRIAPRHNSGCRRNSAFENFNPVDDLAAVFAEPFLHVTNGRHNLYFISKDVTPLSNGANWSYGLPVHPVQE